jgi:hypothetical protein
LLDVRDASICGGLTALAQLRQLTFLELSGDWQEAGLAGRQLEALGQFRHSQPAAVQQLLEQPLPLRELTLWHGSCRLPVLDMALLTKLTKLDVCQCALAEASVVPAQLQRLTLATWDDDRSLAPVTRLQLQQLEHLRLRVEFMPQQPLLQLAQLPALQHLALEYSSATEAAAATASAWPLLPQLRELVIHHGTTNHLPYRVGWAAIMAGIAAATNVTSLKLDPRVHIADDPAVPWYLSLAPASLARLQHVRS